MGGGDAYHRDGVEGVRREFNRLHIQPPVMRTQQFNPFFDPLLDDTVHLGCLTQEATRYVRRVYVGGLPPSANEQTIAKFFNQALADVGGNTAGQGDPVIDVRVNHEHRFAFVEMRAVEEASNAMALDGILFEGVPVRIKRPVDYNPVKAACMGPSLPNPRLNLDAVGLNQEWTVGLQGPDTIFIGGLPYHFTEAQVLELLTPFGPVRRVVIVKDRQTGTSIGYAFCVYQDPSVTDIACAALNSMRIGDRTLTVRRTGQTSQAETILDSRPEQLLNSVGAIPTKVICLVQVVTSDELKDDEAYKDAMEDMRLEACKYVIPRPDPSGHPVSGVGKVFLEFADIYSATKAKMALHGRKFYGKPVVAIYYPELKFAILDLDG